MTINRRTGPNTSKRYENYDLDYDLHEDEFELKS